MAKYYLKIDQGNNRIVILETDDPEVVIRQLSGPASNISKEDVRKIIHEWAEEYLPPLPSKEQIEMMKQQMKGDK